MQIFNVGVNPLIQQLETNLKGVTLYSLPVFGPVEEMEELMSPIEKKTSIIGYVDDLNPVITKVEEFEILIRLYFKHQLWVYIKYGYYKLMSTNDVNKFLHFLAIKYFNF